LAPFAPSTSATANPLVFSARPARPCRVAGRVGPTLEARVNTPQSLSIPLGGSVRIAAFDQLTHVVAVLSAGHVSLRSVERAEGGLRHAAHDLLDDLIDAPLPSDLLHPGAHKQPLLTPADFYQILHAPIHLDEATPLEPLHAAQEAADALHEVFDALEAAFFDDVLDPNGDAARDERRRLRALRGAIDLLHLLAQRGA
jgi:hypothetical protein